ncbi:MAG: 50S ribosomal protein L25, partial [Pseudomonadota bacterium]
RVDERTRIDVDVPVRFLNEETSPGLKHGGVLNVVRHDVELNCPATRIPEQIELDLAEAEIGDSLHISAVTLPDGVRPSITDRDFTIATIVAPRTMRAEADEEGGAEEQEAEASEESDD